MPTLVVCKRNENEKAGFARQLNLPPGRVFVYPLAHWWKLPMGFPAGVNCFQNGFPLNRGKKIIK